MNKYIVIVIACLAMTFLTILTAQIKLMPFKSQTHQPCPVLNIEETLEELCPKNCPEIKADSILQCPEIKSCQSLTDDEIIKLCPEQEECPEQDIPDCNTLELCPEVPNCPQHGKLRNSPEDNRQFAFVVVTPTVERIGGDYIHILAANMWDSIPESRDGINFKKWIIMNGDRQITKYSGLDLVSKTYGSLLRSKWSIKDTNDHSERIEDILENIDDKMGESDERLRWRWKESLDYADCIREGLNSVPEATHIAIIEDDVYLTYDWIGGVIDYLKKGKKILFMFASGNSSNPAQSVATVYEREVAERILQHIEENFIVKPVDLIIKSYANDVFGNNQQFIAKPSLCQHIGLSSSQVGKKQILTSGNFGQGRVGNGITTPAVQ